jgi:hypothetical protein
VEGEMIYAIRAVGTEYVKFGRTTNISRRLWVLDTGSPFELAVEAIAPWRDREERRIHDYLSEYRTKGEWFRDSEITASVIALLKDQEKGYKRWKAIQIAARKAKLRQSQHSAWLASQQNSLRLSSIAQSKATETALQFMQSLLTWELNTLRSIDTSLSTKRENGAKLRLVEH